MRDKHKINNKGFTLIELVVTIGLLALTVGVTNDILVSLLRSYSKIQVKNEIEQQANFVSLKLEKELRSGSQVNIPGGSGDTMSFLTKDNVAVTYMRLSSGIIGRRVGPTGNPEDLTYAGTGGVMVTCGTSCFTLISQDPQVVEIDLTFASSSNGGLSAFAGTVDIKRTIVVRNTY